MKRTLSLVLALMLILSVGNAFAEGLSDVGVYPLTETRETLTILMQQDVLVEDYDTNAFTLWIEDTCNVDLKFELLPAGADGIDKLMLMLSSGQELPDVVNIEMSTLQDYIYGSAGKFIDLTEYYEKYAYYIQKRIEEYPEIDLIGPVTTADGKIYSIPKYYNETIGLTNKRMWMNSALMDNLGLSVPTTTDELYDVLKSMKENDANGNGKNDEIPLLPADTDNLMGYLMCAFIYCNPANNYYTVENGEVGVAYTADAFREGLRYMNMLCSEGLLSPMCFTQTGDQLKQTVDGDGVNPTVGFFINFSTSLSLSNYSTNPFTAQYSAIPPVEGPQGVRYTAYTPTTSSPQWHITSNCKNPELAFRVGDLLTSEEAFLRARIGIPGEHWDYAEPGLTSYFPGRDAKFTFVSIWNESQNAMWRLNIPGFTQDDLDLRFFDGNPINATHTCAVSWDDYKECIPEEYVPTLIFTPEEIDEINEIQSTLKSYVSESIARFITGDMSVENEWESFLLELDNIGLEKYLLISQAAYDRMLAYR